MRSRRILHALLLAALPFASGGCSIKRFALYQVADALAASGTTYAADDDPELIESALPFSLKLIESVLADAPDHKELLTAACKGFTQYAYAFLRQRADELRETDLAASRALRERTKKLYRRALGYGLRSLALEYPGIVELLRKDPRAATAKIRDAHEVETLYWTAASWGLLIADSKDSPDTLGDQQSVEALIDKALALKPDFDRGAVHGFLISYEMIRRTGTGDAATRARHHYEEAVRLSGGKLASVHLAFAEEVALAKADKALFVSCCEKALLVDLDAEPAWRLQNTLAQRRARWQLARLDELFDE